MTPSSPSLPDPDDASQLHDLLSPLKGIEPPLEARIANRLAIATELERLHAASRQQNWPWWRRSVSIPLPIAASALLLGSLALAFGVRGWLEGPSLPVAAPMVHSAMRAAELQEDGAMVASREARANTAIAYYSSEIYLCGIGRVSSESRFGTQEQNP